MRAYLLSVIAMVAVVLALAFTPFQVQAGGTSGSDSGKSTSSGISLQDWKNSTLEEKRSFIFGIVTMLELEKEWQGKNPLPASRSLVGIWVKGLEGVTPRQMVEAVDAHIAKNPADMNPQVLDFLWLCYVQPKLTPAMQKEIRNAQHMRRAK